MIRCSSCSAELSPRVQQKAAAGLKVSGLCQRCYYASIRVARRHCRECGVALANMKAVRCQPCNNRFQAADAEREAYRKQRCLAAFFRPEVRERHNRANARIAEVKMRWCPKEHRDDYHRMVKRIGAAQARAVILDRLTPFERQLSRVLEGKATISIKPDLRPQPYAYTLGGVTPVAL